MKKKLSEEQKKKRRKSFATALLIGVVVFAIFVSFLFGQAYQVMLMSAMVNRALQDTNINVAVNFNETKMVEEIKNNFVPALNATLQAAETRRMNAVRIPGESTILTKEVQHE